MERKHLMAFCVKHELDFQLIDDALTYYENKKYLTSLVESDVDNEKVCAGMEQDYFNHHRIEHYLSCMINHETDSVETGDPVMLPTYSLKALINNEEQPRFSLKEYCKTMMPPLKVKR
jgi:hypothetical protein